MTIEYIQIATLVTILGLLFGQLFVKKKQATHILYAILCGSLAMVVAKDMSGGTLGPYQYLVGLGACATCNCFWLLSRTLFRTSNAISMHHLFLAGIIALLIMANQGYLFIQTSNFSSDAVGEVAPYILRELTVLLSSCILVLSFWEGCRGFSDASQVEKAQRLMFLGTFCAALIASRYAKGVYADDPIALTSAITTIIFFMLVSTQVLIIWRGKSKPLDSTCDSVIENRAKRTVAAVIENAQPRDESELSKQVKTLVDEESLFLQPNLKVADLARKLDVPEYRVSNALRYNLKARNFNHFINEYRIQYAKTILSDPDKKHWSVLVVGIESGFASVGPFTRAFKSETGFTPNQFRQDHPQQVAS